MKKTYEPIYTDARFLHVCKNKCDQCLFSPNRIVSKERMQEILDDCAKNNSQFLCHKFQIKHPKSKVICRGFYEEKDSVAMQFAKRYNIQTFEHEL